jgi:hypothetical protein
MSPILHKKNAMKRLVLLFFILVSFTQAYAQVFTLDDMTALMIKGKDISALDDSLQSNGWEYESGAHGGAVWTYGDEDGLIAKLLVYGGYSITYTFPNNKEVYDAIKEKAISYKMQKIKSEPLEDGIRIAYMGKNYVLRMMPMKREWGFLYKVELYTKDEYKMTVIVEEAARKAGL